MKHNPEDDVLPPTTILSSTRWGLRTGITSSDRRKMRKKMLGQPSVRKFRHYGRRSFRDRICEVETPLSQIGAKWCTPSPVYNVATYIPDPRSYHSTVVDGTPVFGDHGFDLVTIRQSRVSPEDLEEEIESATDHALENWGAPTLASEAKRLPLLFPPYGDLQEDFIKDERFVHLLELVKRFPNEADQHVRPLLIEIGRSTPAWDYRVLLPLGDSEASTHDLLWLVVNALVGDNFLAKRNKETYDRRHPNQASFREEKLDRPETKKKRGPRFSKQEQELPAPPRPRQEKPEISPWKIYGELITTCLRVMHQALGKQAPPMPWPNPRTQGQLNLLEDWANEDNLNPRERMLRAWRLRTWKAASYMRSQGDLSLHEEPRLVTALAYAENGFKLGGFDAGTIRRFFQGHPSQAVREVLDEFETEWTRVNSIRVGQTPPPTTSSSTGVDAQLTALLGPGWNR